MSFFNRVKNIFGNKKSINIEEQNSFLLNEPKNVDDFFIKSFEIIKSLKESKTIKNSLLELINISDSNIIYKVSNKIRKELYKTEYIDELESDITNNLISIRFSLLNPIYKKNKDKRLAKLFMIFFSIAPDLMKGKKSVEKSNLFNFSVDEDVDEILSDLSFFNLSEKEIKYTASKIVEFNKKNVAYTNEEIIFLNNSETLRRVLEKLSSILHDFVQQASMWERYFNPENLGLKKYKINILNSDKKLLFKDKFYSGFFDLIMEKNINNELKPLINKDLNELFERDFNLVIGSLRNKILSEHKKLIFDFEKILAWGIVLLKELDELPPHNVLNSLIAKSLKFHENYYPDLVQAVNPVREKILLMLKEDYSGLNSFLFCYEKHICEGIKYYSNSKFKSTLNYDDFVNNLSNVKGKHEFDPIGNHVVEYYPEELNLLKRSPDAELSIIMLNEKLIISEKGLPILDGDYFFSSKVDFLKVVLFDTLLNMMNDTASLKVIRSLLMKSLDKNKGESSDIMEMLLQRLREEGFKKDLIVKLHKKLLNKNHVTSRIKKKIAGNTTWEWLVASEDPNVVLAKFSKVTGLTFFTLSGSKGQFSITATFKDNDWFINRIAPLKK